MRLIKWTAHIHVHFPPGQGEDTYPISFSRFKPPVLLIPGGNELIREGGNIIDSSRKEKDWPGLSINRSSPVKRTLRSCVNTGADKGRCPVFGPNWPRISKKADEKGGGGRKREKEEKRRGGRHANPRIIRADIRGGWEGGREGVPSPLRPTEINCPRPVRRIFFFFHNPPPKPAKISR